MTRSVKNNLVGQKFVRLTVVERVENISKSSTKPAGFVAYKCICDCGNINVVAPAQGLKNGNNKSCGYLHKELVTERARELGKNKMIDLTDQIFGSLTVIRKAPDNTQISRQGIRWLCKCQCGNDHIVLSQFLISGQTQSCGCSKIIDLVGEKFYNLSVIERVYDIRSTNGRIIWRCRCDCGVEALVSSQCLLNGDTKSCGGGCRLRDGCEVPARASAKRIWREIYGDGDLTFEEFLQLSQQNCVYCNVPPSNRYNWAESHRYNSSQISKQQATFIYNGLDRINSNLPHNKNNVVPCCIICNRMKSNLELHKFTQHIENIYNFYIKGDK